jgi:hypothetical protein
MAKKVRRARRTIKPSRNNDKQTRSEEQRKLTVEEELREEYAYVAKDLKRVAILAMTMFVLLIVLNLLLR